MILTDDYTTSVILEHEPGTFYVVRGGRVQTVLRVAFGRDAKYQLEFEGGTKGFNTLHEAEQAARTLTRMWVIRRGSYIVQRSAMQRIECAV